MINSLSMSDLIESWLGDINYDKDDLARDLYKFKARVGVIKYAAPRHECFELLLDIGRNLIDKVYHIRPIRQDVLTFIFPERHLSVVESTTFMKALNLHPDAKKFKMVNIITSSPQFITNFFPEQIRIIQFPDDHLHDGNRKNGD